jgi:hypothetical protein
MSLRWIRRLFWIAGIYGLVVLPPHYFLENRISADQPPVITHAEYFYGFLGVAIAWQIAFLIIGTDPARYRPLIIPCILEKLSFAFAVAALYAYGRVPITICAFAAIDFLLGVLFTIAFVQLRNVPRQN